MQHRLAWRVIVGFDERGRAAPPDFDAAKQIGFGARHAKKRRRLEAQLRAENVRIGTERHRRAAPVDRPHFLELALGHAARIALRKKLLVAGDFDRQFLGQRVDDGNADAVKPPRSLIDFV